MIKHLEGVIETKRSVIKIAQHVFHDTYNRINV